MQKPHIKQIQPLGSSAPTSPTWTDLRVAQPRRITNTILAAVCARRIAAISILSPTATGFRTHPKIGPSAVQRTVASNAVYKAAKYALGVVIPYQVRP